MDLKVRRDLFSGKVKPEFGNIDHIKLIQGAEYRKKQLTEGMSLDIGNDDEPDGDGDYFLHASFNCVCGETILFQRYSYYHLDDELLAQEDNQTCWNCKREYETYLDDVVFVKLVT